MPKHNVSDSEPEYFTPLHHEVAAQLGYKQTPGYATWDKVEETAPVQVIDRIVRLVHKEREADLTPSEMLLAENKRLIEAGDALYEAASYTGRSFDGTHRLLSAAAKWLDTRGKNSGKYQRQLTNKEEK